jgi:hypothetical protein
MKSLSLVGLGLLVVGASALPAQEVLPVPADLVAERAGAEARRMAAAVESIRAALKDLPAGADADQIRRALDRIQKQALKDLESQLALATSELEMRQERAAWAARMATRGFLSKAQAEADRVRARVAAAVVERLQEQRRRLVPRMKPGGKD